MCGSIRAASCATARHCGSRTNPHPTSFKSGSSVRAVVQRVTEARVRIEALSSLMVGEIGRGLVVVLRSVLVVSQFTLFGDIRKGRRRAFDAAAPPEHARALYESVVRELRAAQLPVATGEFQAMMRVELVNDGPVTILIDSKRQF